MQLPKVTRNLVRTVHVASGVSGSAPGSYTHPDMAAAAAVQDGDGAAAVVARADVRHDACRGGALPRTRCSLNTASMLEKASKLLAQYVAQMAMSAVVQSQT